VLNFLFVGGPPPPEPGPTLCGPDKTDALVLELDCQVYNSCDQSDGDGDGWTRNGVIEASVLMDLDRDDLFETVFAGSNDWINIQLIKNRPDDPIDCADPGGGGGAGTPEVIDCVVE